MAGAIMDKVWGLFGGVDQGETEEYDDDDAYEYEDKSANYENNEEEKGFFGKKNQSKGVKVTVEENTALIEIEVVVKFGINIKNACEEVQQKVKNAVETMTGLEVVAVNINVQGIIFEKEEKKSAEVEVKEETKE